MWEEMTMARILRGPEVIMMTGLSRVSIWRKERLGEFPRRLQFGVNSVGWNSAEIDAWIESRPEGCRTERHGS